MIPQAIVTVTRLTAQDRTHSTGVRLEVTNWNQVMKTLSKLDKEYVKELRKDFRKIAKPVQTAIRKAIPSKARRPLSGMRQVHFGRLAWGSNYGDGAKPSKSVIIQTPSTRTRKARQFDVYPIVRLKVLSPATALFDMAGRANYARGRKGDTPVYDYMYTINGNKVPGRRKHKVVPLAFAKGLASANGSLQFRASRIVWPSAEKALPLARAMMDSKISQVNLKINSVLRSK